MYPVSGKVLWYRPCTHVECRISTGMALNARKPVYCQHRNEPLIQVLITSWCKRPNRIFLVSSRLLIHEKVLRTGQLGQYEGLSREYTVSISWRT